MTLDPGLTRYSCVLAVAAGGCGLVAPFELGALPEAGLDADDAEAVSDADGDADADDEADANGEADVDPDAEPDGDPWDGYTCAGSEVAGERWIVATVLGGVLQSWLTGRDCDAPELLCTGCYVTAISPDGEQGLAVEPEDSTWPLFDQIFLVDLTAPGSPPTPLGLRGGHPAWRDSDSFYYLVPSEGHEVPCSEAGGYDRTDVMLHQLSTGERTRVLGEEPRLWSTCCPTGPASGAWLALPVDYGDYCEAREPAVTVYELPSAEPQLLEWTMRYAHERIFGLLPDDEGFLIQVPLGDEGPSDIVQVLYDRARAASRTIYHDLDDVGATWGLLHWQRPFWGQCATVRRLGPACEFYCHEDDVRILRLDVDGEAIEEVTCPIDHDRLRIMDVQQW